MKWPSVLFMPIVLGMTSFVATAATITFVTPSGSSVADGPVEASAEFVTADGMLTITLSNLLVDPRSVGQNVSDLQFSLSSSTSPILSSSTAAFVTVNDDGSTTPAGSGTTGWGFGTFGTGLILCIICPDGLEQPPAAQPAETIIGPSDTFPSANASIAGNIPHNPFLHGSAMFVITDPGITSATTVSNVVFSFGTTFGSDVPGESDGGGGGGTIPEPVSPMLTVCALAALGALRRSFMT